MSTHFKLHDYADVRIVKEVICEHEICHVYGCKKEQQEDFYMCDYHYGVTCGDHLVPIKECGCRI